MSVSSLPLEPQPGEPARRLPTLETRRKYAQHCSLIATDIASFSRRDRDEEIQLHLRKSLYEIFAAAFHDIGIPWDDPDGLYREDRGDGIAMVFMPLIPTGKLLAELPDPLLAELRHHNKVSSPAAQIQLRLALHAGLVTYDTNGFAGNAAIHTFRILDAAPVKRDPAESNAALALIASDYVYDNFISNMRGPVGPDAYAPVKVNVKNTRTRAWYRLAGGPPPDHAQSARSPVVHTGSRRNPRKLKTSRADAKRSSVIDQQMGMPSSPIAPSPSGPGPQMAAHL